MAEKISDQIRSLWAELQTSLSLNLDYARLTASEKITVFLSTCVVSIVSFVLISLMLFFLSLLIVTVIAEHTGIIGAYAIMAGFYLLVLLLLIIFRKPLVIDPIAKFITRLLFTGF